MICVLYTNVYAMWLSCNQSYDIVVRQLSISCFLAFDFTINHDSCPRRMIFVYAWIIFHLLLLLFFSFQSIRWRTASNKRKKNSIVLYWIKQNSIFARPATLRINSIIVFLFFFWILNIWKYRRRHSNGQSMRITINKYECIPLTSQHLPIKKKIIFSFFFIFLLLLMATR